MTNASRPFSPALGLPRTLFACPSRWIEWELQARNGKPTKVPMLRGALHSTGDPGVDANELVGKSLTTRGGVGFLLSGGVQLPDGTWLTALDLDACRDPASGRMREWATEVVEHFRSYAEVSPSGTGLRVWLRTTERPPPLAKIKIEAEPLPEGLSKQPEIQVFGTGARGYVTVTGDTLDPARAEIVEVPDLGWLVEHFGAVETSDASADELPHVDDAPDVEAVREAVIHALGQDALDARWELLGFPSASELWWKLVNATVRAAHGDGAVAVDFLLHCTAFGSGDVDSRDPDRYRRVSWVVSEVLRAVAKGGHHTIDELFGELPIVEPPEPQSSDLIVPVAQIRDNAAQQGFLVRGVLPHQGLAMIFGAPGTGKTTYAVSLAAHVALGRASWHGHDLNARTGEVVYMIGEDPGGVAWRCVAQVDSMQEGTTLDDLPNLRASTRPGELTSTEDAAKWAAAIGRTIDLLVVDTLNMNFGAGNESDTEAMTAFVQNCARLSQKLRCLVLIVHHSGRGSTERSRGNSALDGACDAIFKVEPTVGSRVAATCTKAKNWSVPHPIEGEMQPVEIGRDDENRPITAITLSPGIAFEVIDDDLVGRLLAAVRDLDGRETDRDYLAERTGANYRTVTRRIDLVVDQGLVEPVSRGPGRPLVLRLTDEGARTLEAWELLQ